MQATVRQAWLERWQRHILATAERRYCDREMGEEIGWLVSPFLQGFYHGYLATGDAAWVERFVDWAQSWVRRGLQEPDGYVGWPKAGGASTTAVPDLYTDNLLGEAMGLRPLALMAQTILRTPALASRYGPCAQAYQELNEHIFEKWDRRGCWRAVPGGGLWVVAPFGLDPTTGRWTGGYEERTAGGFSMPANKQNAVALWLMALHALTGKPVYQERAGLWWQWMKTRMRGARQGRYVWNYWDPAGAWDWRPDGSARHWIGVHPNGGYYDIDVDGIVTAYEHGLVFEEADVACLIATNRDFMWNGQVIGAQFRRIDGGEPDPRWKHSPGCLWRALVPYDQTLREVFEANHDPAGWGGLATTPWYLAHGV